MSASHMRKRLPYDPTLGLSLGPHGGPKGSGRFLMREVPLYNIQQRTRHVHPEKYFFLFRGAREDQWTAVCGARRRRRATALDKSHGPASDAQRCHTTFHPG